MPENIKPVRDAADAIDLTNCDREPIHILGNVQSFGALIAVSTDWIVTHISENVGTMLGLDPDQMVGRSFSDFMPENSIHMMRSKLQMLGSENESARIFGFEPFEDGRKFDLSMHASGRAVVLEFENKSSDERRDDLALVQSLMGRIRKRTTVADMSREAARALKALTGFDRVMVYQFAEDHSGNVIAEARNGDLEPFLGLRYPASDIPQQARELYKRSLLRLIGDVDDEPVAIVPRTTPEGLPLDLSLAVTRAVSPIHLEYLRNMGVHASMSVSIMRKGELWGLFACHHQTPRYIDYERRSAVELFAQLFAYDLADKEYEAEREQTTRARKVHDAMMSQVSSGMDLITNFDSVADQLAQAISFDGIALFSDGRYEARGSAPTEEEFLGLARFLNTTATSTVFATNNLANRYEKADSIADRVAGLLALPVSRTPRDYIVLFRREVVQTVTWAGNPEKPVQTGPNGIRLTPRKSFEAWKEIKHNTAQPWTQGELRTADALRVTLLEVVLKVTDETNLVRKRAQEQQELLIAELNHRVRNILNLIRGLVSQGRSEADSLENFTSVLDGRIHALARAHDQLTRHDWQSSSLRDLLDIEMQAYLTARSERVVVRGDDVLLTPDAFSTLALVIHEMMTNSAKYGALADGSGYVEVDIERTGDGALSIQWRERNGPPVQAPKRHGFGTAIIERSIPFELNGKTDLRFKMTGVEIDLLVPSVHVSDAPRRPPKAAVAVQPEPVEQAGLNGAVLLVEDNMIIALDAQDMLVDLGATQVVTSSTVWDALDQIGKTTFQAAVLDVNLGAETSAAIADRLREREIPYVLATGYGDIATIREAYGDTVVLKKPYDDEMLKRALSEVLAAAAS